MKPISQLDPSDLRSAARLRMSHCVVLQLSWLERRFGPLVLLHRLVGGGRGEVSWCPAQGYQPGPHEVEWARAGASTLHILDADVPALREAQLVLDMAFGGDPELRLYTEFRIVSIWRPLSDSEAELLEQAAFMETRQLLKRTARRKGEVR